MPESTSNLGGPDPKEFVRLLAVYERRLGAFVLSLVPHWADADEIVQETKVKLWEQFSGYDPTKDFGTWSRTIAYYQVLTYRKRSSRERATLSDTCLERVAEAQSQHDEMLARRHKALAMCLEKLDEAKRSLLLRYYAAGESLRDIATELGRSYDSVRKGVFRTRVTLADCIEETLAREEQE